MTFATTAAAKSMFGDALSAQQRVASNTPATAIALKFADYLAEKQSANHSSPSPAGFAPTPEMLAQTLFGDVYDAKTQSVRIEKLAADVQKRTAEFAGQLRARLAAAKIDNETPLDLSVGADGRIIVDSGHPQAAEIAKLFADDPTFAQSYRNIAARNDHAAMLQVGAAYVKDWKAASTDNEQAALWKRYSTLMDRVAGMFSGRMTFGPGTATAESQQILRRMGVV